MQARHLVVCALALLACWTAGAAAKQEGDQPGDVHVHVAAVAHSAASSSERLLGIEGRFDNRHARFMGKLKQLHTKVSKHVDDVAAGSLVETEAAEVVLPIVDDTGSLAGQPRANRTRFTVKPTIDVNFVADAQLFNIQPAKAPAIALQPVVFQPILPPQLVAPVKPTNSLMEVEAELAPIVDGTGSLAGQPRVNRTRFTVKPSIDQTLVQDAAAVRSAPITTFLELETDIDTEFDKLNFADDERRAMEMASLADSLIEQSAVIAPIVDGTGGDSFTPKANLTRFRIKPTVDNSLIQDAALAAAAAAALKTTSFLEVGAVEAPIIDGTGSVEHGQPKANLTRFTVKPSIDVNFAQDAKLFNIQPTKAATVAQPAAVVQSAPVAGQSLLELHQHDCPTCKNRVVKVSHEVVVSPVAAPNSLDQPLWAEQHRKVNYLLKGQTLSIKERHLSQGRSTVVESADAHERFHDFTDKLKNEPLVPRDTTMVEVASTPEATLLEMRAEMAADFPEMAQSMMEVESHSQAIAAISNRGPKGNYPGWSSFLETAARDHASHLKEQAEAAADEKRSEQEDTREPLMVQAPSPVQMNLPPAGPNVAHIRLGVDDTSAVLQGAGGTGVKKVKVHVYGKADPSIDDARRLKGLVRRLANDQTAAYEKINRLIRKLKKCGVDSKNKECLKTLTDKMEDWKSEFTQAKI